MFGDLTLLFRGDQLCSKLELRPTRARSRSVMVHVLLLCLRAFRAVPRSSMSASRGNHGCTAEICNVYQQSVLMEELPFQSVAAQMPTSWAGLERRSPLLRRAVIKSFNFVFAMLCRLDEYSAQLPADPAASGTRYQRACTTRMACLVK